MYEGFVQSLVDEIKAGFVAEAKFDPDEQLTAAYAQEVQQKIGSNGQAPLLELRSSGVIALRNALKRMASKAGIGAEQIGQVSLK